MLILLAAAVLVVVIFRVLRLPALLGYLLVGTIIGPHALGLVPHSGETRYLAEFGVVFPMFSIGLEFSLPKLVTMRRMVFGLGAAQVGAVLVLCLAGVAALGHDWRTGVVLGGVFAMSSTAILGAAEVVAEILEGSLMLATQALMLLGVPLNRVLRRIRQMREQRYGLFRGLYRGATDEVGADGEKLQPRLHSVVLPPGSAAVGNTLKELDLPRLNVEASAIRRRNIRSSTPDPETWLTVGDVVVLRGRREDLEVADMYLMQG